jgi:hypothetical protein
MLREQAIESMQRYFKEQRHIDHTIKVLSYGERIMAGEAEGRGDIPSGFHRSVVTLACVYHDIGIPEAKARHGSIDAPFQEELGPPVARRLMEGIGVRPDLVERVVYLVGNHHSMDKIDGEDFQILWEADFLVNVQEGTITLETGTEARAVERNLKTRTGRGLAAGIPELTGL